MCKGENVIHGRAYSTFSSVEQVSRDGMSDHYTLHGTVSIVTDTAFVPTYYFNVRLRLRVRSSFSDMMICGARWNHVVFCGKMRRSASISKMSISILGNFETENVNFDFGLLGRSQLYRDGGGDTLGLLEMISGSRLRCSWEGTTTKILSIILMISSYNIQL